VQFRLGGEVGRGVPGDGKRVSGVIGSTNEIVKVGEGLGVAV
jgi:hypothetical protein